jgi:DNA polymerase I-like protein with 3'-5' exonuclease and polymerase domains
VTFYDTHIGFDLETDGTLPEYALQPWRHGQGKAWVTSLVWLIPSEEPRGGMYPHSGDLQRMLEYAIKTNKTIVGWNVVFDIQWLLSYGLEELVFKAKWLDAMLLWKHATVEPEYEAKGRPGKRKSYSLKVFVPEHFPEHAGYEAEITYHNPNEEQLEQLHEYNIKDVIFTLKGAKMYWERLTPRQQRCALIESECLPLVAATNLRGMLIDSLHLHHLRAELERKARMKLAKLERFNVDETVVRSPAKLRKVMFEDWGLTPLKKTPAGVDSTDKETLHELAISSKDWRVKCLRTYRETLNAIGKFVDSPLEAAEYNGDGYARPQFIPFSTYTGRFTVSSKQKILKNKKIKGEELEE